MSSGSLFGGELRLSVSEVKLEPDCAGGVDNWFLSSFTLLFLGCFICRCGGFRWSSMASGDCLELGITLSILVTAAFPSLPRL